MSNRKIQPTKYMGLNESKMVSEFHYVTGVKELDKPGFPDKETINLRFKLIREELDELEEAIENNDLTETLDAFVDIQYVLSGAIAVFGMKDIFNKAFDIIHENNLSKICIHKEDAEKSVSMYEDQGIRAGVRSGQGYYIVYRKKDGKILKPWFYKKPNLDSLLR